jgi:hypothetical protein
MQKKIFYFVPLALVILILISIIEFADPVASFIENHSDNPQEYTIKALWQKTWGRQLSLCIITGGTKIRTNYWYEKLPKYKCVYPYSDRGKSCKNSNDCKGECIIISPSIDLETYLHPSEDAILKKFNCSGLTSYETWKPSDPKKIYEKYRCEKDSFKAQCAAFEWNQYNQWTLNDSDINYLMVGEAL